MPGPGDSSEDLRIAARWGVGTLRDARGLVRLARELIATPKSWTKYAYARDRKGHPVIPGNNRPKPVAWCALGSLLEAEHRRSGRRFLSGEAGDDLHIPIRLVLAVQAAMLGCVEAFLADREAAAGYDRDDTNVDELQVPEPASVLLSRANDAPETTHEDILRGFASADALITLLLRAREQRNQRPK